MKTTKLMFPSRLTALGPSAALMLTMLALIVAATTTAAQTPVFVPGNTNGCFGNAVDMCVPLVAALTVNGPGTITVTYVSGTITDAGNVNTGPNGVSFPAGGYQVPFQEASGIALERITHLDALIGVFVPQSRVQRVGFSAIDGTKNATRVGIMPNKLFFIGTGKTFSVSQAGTLFLGINDCWVSDNGGGFNVTVSGP